MLAGLKSYLFRDSHPLACGTHTLHSGEASYVAQRSTYEFSRNTLAWFGQSAFGDPAFNDAFAVCRWEAFAAIAATDLRLAVLLDGGPDLDPALVRIYADALGEYPAPSIAPDGWSDRHAALLSGSPESPPITDPTSRPWDTGRRADSRIRAARSKNARRSARLLAAAVTFGLISFNDRLPRRLDAMRCGRRWPRSMIIADIFDRFLAGRRMRQRARTPGHTPLEALEMVAIDSETTDWRSGRPASCPSPSSTSQRVSMSSRTRNSTSSSTRAFHPCRRDGHSRIDARRVAGAPSIADVWED